MVSKRAGLRLLSTRRMTEWYSLLSADWAWILMLSGTGLRAPGLSFLEGGKRHDEKNPLFLFRDALTSYSSKTDTF